MLNAASIGSQANSYGYYAAIQQDGLCIITVRHELNRALT